MTTRFIERMAVEIDGEGDAVLMLHGLGGTSNTWAPLLPAVERYLRVRPDFPGSGRSDRVEGPLSLDKFVTASLRALAAAGAERAHVIAHSMGTIVAQHLAALHPAVVRSLALFGPLLAPPEPARANIRARAQKARSEGVTGMQAIADTLVQVATSSSSKQKRHAAVAFVRESLMRQNPEGYAQSCEALADMQPVETSKINCPTLLVTGDEDGVAPPQAVRQMGDRIAGSGTRVQVEVLARLWSLDTGRDAGRMHGLAATLPRAAEMKEGWAMGNVLFTNVRILDGSGAAPFPGELMVQGNRIVRVGRGARSLPTANVTAIDGAGATLMPGMVEAHTHFSWNDAATLQEIQRMPLEEHVLWSAHVAKRYLEAGFTSCVGAACAKARLDVVTRNAINEGLIPGPRYLAASQEITVAGGLGDETLPHAPWQEFSFGIIVSGPEEMRKWVRMFLKYGVDSIKLNLSGDNFVPGAGAETTWMSDEEVAVAVSETKMRGKRLAAHARSCASIKQCVKHGIEVIYHASFVDEEALDMLEARKDRHFVAPGIAILYAMLNEAEAYGITRSKAVNMGYQIEWDAALESLTKMHKRGIRVLPGGDYGFAFTPHCQNARDLEFFVKYLGMTPMEAIQSATKYGGEIMMRGNELGQLKEGFLADLLLVDGDPLSNLSVLREPTRLLAVMKDGVFYKEPPIASARTRWASSAA